ncbi:MAG TPA: hypothetical protein VHE78_00290 [Gemmatimonadaceae bacterium]|nr:hypothetical protein [Gemmatimonadaceae bacterium]
MSIATAASSVYAIHGEHRAYESRPTAGRLPNCRNPGAFSQHFASVWVKRTVSDTSFYARTARADAAIPQTSPDSVSLVSDETVCGTLMAKFARVARGRDTLAPLPVLVVRIAPSKYVVSDLKTEGTSFANAVTQYEWSEFATMTVALDSVRIWRYRYSEQAY